MFALFAADAAKSDLPVWVGLLLIPILIAINGYFVAAEFAFVSIRRTRVEEMVNQGVKGAKRLLAAVTDLDRSVGAAQLGITVASLALGFVSEPALHNLIDLLFNSLNLQLSSTVMHVTSVLLTLSLITYMHVVFGEQMPKIAALQSSEKIGLWTAGPLNVFAIATKPVIRLMNGSSSLFLRLFGYKATDSHGEIYTVDELRLLIEDTEEAGVQEAGILPKLGPPSQAEFHFAHAGRDHYKAAPAVERALFVDGADDVDGLRHEASCGERSHCRG